MGVAKLRLGPETWHLELPIVRVQGRHRFGRDKLSTVWKLNTTTGLIGSVTDQNMFTELRLGRLGRRTYILAGRNVSRDGDGFRH